ncbi:hypothetical protein X943_000703 [Babesia divergens]|uniref:Uncharacterized protein n=1 Tax=Babesia divergens TaxID=32595 RepID=A0AAD9LKY3_BABDI|nr:hypothetical protein X943_000703 [Babesia divergens]
MEIGIFGLILATLKLVLALSPLLLIVAIFVVNKNCNQRSTGGVVRGARFDYLDSDDEDDKKHDW